MTRVIARVFFKTIILSLCLLWSAQSALATTVVRPLDDDMIVGARAIITGKVLQIESAIDAQDRIYTYITVRVSDVIKGQITERKVILKEPGGVVGNRISVVYGSPEFTLGQKVLLYLSTHDDGSLRTYQLFLGKFSIVKDEATGNRFVVRDTGGESVTVLTGLPGQPQGDSTDRMELSSYTDMVRSRLAANLERSRAFEQAYFRNVPVLASPPGFVSSKNQVRPDYTFLGNVRWFQPDSGQAVPYTVNPNPSATPGVPQAVVDSNDIAAAANAWSVVPGCSLRLSFSGNLDSCYTQTGTPGINVVSNNCDGYNQPTAGCASILAIGGWSGGGFQTRVIGGITFGQITQGFVSFNPWSCEFANNCRVQEIATHELGHALGLGHSADSTATMYGIAHFDGRCASLKQDDMNGIAFLYPGSGGGPGPLTVVTSALSGGTVGTSYSQSLTASGGTLPYSWSVVAGLGSLPAGLSLSAGGTISGTPSAVGTYNFTVKVTDAASASAQKALSIVVTAAGAAALDSQFVSQTVPTTLQPGQSFDVNMKFLNTGTQTWSGSLFYLVSQNPPQNPTWGGQTGGYALPIGSFATAPGQQLDVTFTVFAPATAGTYNFQWQAYKNDGTGFFGQMSTNVVVTVGSTSLTDNASFATQNVPGTMTQGQTYSVSVTMNNTGTTTWTVGNYYLGSQNPSANSTWGLNRVNVTSPVAPGGQSIFTFNVTAPSTPGTHNFQWRMASDSGGGFGALSANVAIVVTSTLKKVARDFDGDRKSDLSVWRPSAGNWYVINSSTGSAQVRQWGSSSDKVVPGDYDGDGKTDFAVWRPSEGNWYIINSSSGAATARQWGISTDIPVPGDYDGDGKTDIAVWRPSEGNWYIINSSTGTFQLRQWGLSTDKVVPGDYDGDGKTDIAVWRPSEGNWYIINSSTGAVTGRQWGMSTDVPVPGDYDGDGKTDIGVWRPSEGNWFVINSSTGAVTIHQWGTSTDKVVPGDYDGDGKTDIAVWRPSEGNWHIINSSTGAGQLRQWGTFGDVPVPSALIM